jgi:hypothetical protein
MPNQRKYRSEFWRFRTAKGIERKMVCILAGDNERQRMLAKAQQIARTYQWRLL